MGRYLSGSLIRDRQQDVCYVTGILQDKQDMIKLVVSPEKILCFDIKYNLLGESFFVTNSRLMIVKFLQIMNNKGRFIEEYKRFADCIYEREIKNSEANSVIETTIEIAKIISDKKLDYIIKLLFKDSLSGPLISSKKILLDDIALSYLKQLLSIISLAKKSGNLVVGKEKINNSIKKAGIIVQGCNASAREKFSNYGKLEICEVFDIAQLSKASGVENTRYLLITNQIADYFKKFYRKYNCYLKV
jgi:predicted RNA-binding protein YlxR (DUF448 family)